MENSPQNTRRYTDIFTVYRFDGRLGGYSINESVFEYIVNPNLDSVKMCILLTNLNVDPVSLAK